MNLLQFLKLLVFCCKHNRICSGDMLSWVHIFFFTTCTFCFCSPIPSGCRLYSADNKTFTLKRRRRQRIMKRVEGGSTSPTVHRSPVPTMESASNTNNKRRCKSKCTRKYINVIVFLSTEIDLSLFLFLSLETNYRTPSQAHAHKRTKFKSILSSPSFPTTTRFQHPRYPYIFFLQDNLGS